MLFAQPWWVNLLILIPAVSLYFWRRERLAIEWKTLVAAAAFAAAFGFVEAACVDYLRGNVPSLQSLTIQPSDLANPQALHLLPDRLLKTETFREIATMIMLIAVPFLGARRARERWALFLWCFSIWDLVYYGGLRATIHWPTSLRDIDVLFLIPRPWFAEIWYPVLVSAATISAVMLGTQRTSGGSVRKSLPSESQPTLPGSPLVRDVLRESMSGSDSDVLELKNRTSKYTGRAASSRLPTPNTR
jgi:hypothetical protein